jgi:CMP-N,N'-diacetyllegionaminic acid synthase
MLFNSGKESDDVKILCVVPARSGSKGVPNKNIRMFQGIPLLAHSVLQAQKSKYYRMIRVVVSTDSKQYADIAKSYGAECPFLRPQAISGDFSTDLECMQHCLGWLEKCASYVPDFVLHLRPTQPLRKVEHIDNCIETFLRVRSEYDSLRTVVSSHTSPFKMYTISEKEGTLQEPLLKPLFQQIDGMREPFNNARQSLPKSYVHNGYVDIINAKVILGGAMSGDHIFPVVMSPKDVVDIDTEDDWEEAQQRVTHE